MNNNGKKTKTLSHDEMEKLKHKKRIEANISSLQKEVESLKKNLDEQKTGIDKINAWKNKNKKLFEEKETKLTEYIFQINSYSMGILAIYFTIIFALIGFITKWEDLQIKHIVTISSIIGGVTIVFFIVTYIMIKERKRGNNNG